MAQIRREQFDSPVDLMQTVRDLSNSGAAPVPYIPGVVLDRSGVPVGFQEGIIPDFQPGELDEVIAVNSPHYREETDNPEAREADALDRVAIDRTLQVMEKMGLVKQAGPGPDFVDLIGLNAHLGGEAIALSELDVTQIERIIARAHLRNLKAQMDKAKEVYAKPVQRIRRKGIKGLVQKRGRPRKVVSVSPEPQAPESSTPAS